MTSPSDRIEWQIAVFCQNERTRIAACLQSIARAIGNHRALITVIVNGSTDSSAETALAVSRDLGIPTEVFDIETADKSNAINIFFTDLRHNTDLCFFIDGYVTIGPNALSSLAATLASHPTAQAVSGVAANGRTSAQATQRAAITGGALHGQFHALRPEFIDRFVARNLRLPTRLYRGDGLLGSMLAHDLDAAGQDWLNTRALTVADATFTIDALSRFRWKDLKRQFRRKIRQMRGKLETAAIQKVIYAGGYESLPADADTMIAAYLRHHEIPRVSLLDRPFMALALRHHRAAGPPPEPAHLQPRRIGG